MPTKLSVQRCVAAILADDAALYAGGREFWFAFFAVVTLLFAVGWLGAEHIGIADGRAMPVPVRLIPPTEFATAGLLGTFGEEPTKRRWSDVLLVVDYVAMRDGAREDTDEQITVQLLRPGV